MSHRLLCVEVERVGRYDLFVAQHTHVIEERRLLCGSIVFAPVSHKLVSAVHQLTAFKEVSIAVKTVVIEAVGVERTPTVLHHHVASRHHHLLHAVVFGIVAREREGVALPEPHMSERLHGIVLLKEIGAVAPQVCPLMPEMHASLGYLRVRIESVGVIFQFVGMHEIHPLVVCGTLPLCPWYYRRCHETKSKQA